MNNVVETRPSEQSSKSSPANSETRPSTAPTCSESGISLVGGIRLSKWRRQVGVSRTTVWRWRKSGRLPVVTRYGVAFLSAETVKNFFADDDALKSSRPTRGAGSVKPQQRSNANGHVTDAQ